MLAISMTTPALFRRYPELAGRLARVPILKGPTPVHRMAGLEQETGAGPLWIKRDDLTAEPYGGNKPRKLEFILGQALERGARSLITFGGLGSNHVLATAVYGRQHGLSVTAILVPQPVDEHIRTKVVAMHRMGVRLVYAPSKFLAVIAAVMVWVRSTALDGRRPYVIPPGGSSPVGALGYVSAALELAEQVRGGELPVPDAIFIASGSNGTASGLLVGLRLAGLPSRLVVVRTTDLLFVHPRSIADLSNATSRLLNRLTATTVSAFGPSDVEVWHDYVGAGYGYPTLSGDRAVALLAKKEGIVLDRVYTGKAMAALLDALTRPEWRNRAVLFWHTYSHHLPGPMNADETNVAQLPRPFPQVLG